jgi:simple sugar transport system substrate-binding protein
VGSGVRSSMHHTGSAEREGPSMRRLFGGPLAVTLALVALAGAAGCTTPDDQVAGGGEQASASTEESGGTQTQQQGPTVKTGPLTFAMVTHGDAGSFWSVVKRGAQDGAKAMGVSLRYTESNNDPQKQAQMIEAALSQNVDGLAVSAPNVDALRGALRKARAAGIPIVTLNSGAEESASLGAFTHVGQTETIAGEGAGQQLKEAGVTKLLCIIHEQGNLGLNQRCEGAKKGFGGNVINLQVKGTADVATTLTELQSRLEADNSIDGVLALNPDIAIAARDAVQGAGSDAKVATFDLSGDVVRSIQDGRILFAVDQQQYEQGYLPIVFLTLNRRNLNTVGGGRPVLTGPGYVTRENAAAVLKLAEAGTR